MTSIVALDIETTGLEPKQDAIIEIGAVRFNARRVEAEWSSLIHPGRPIPPIITNLTGITDQMVLQAPVIHAILPDLVEFVGDSPVLGHNVKFDLAFLQRHGILGDNEPIDTYDLAAVILPRAGRYNLGALAQALGVLLPATHRALDDAKATRGVYLRLLELIQELPINLIAEMVRLSEPLNWGGTWTLRRALRARAKEIISPEQARHIYRGPLFDDKPRHPVAPRRPVAEPVPLDAEEAASVLEYGGPFARHFPYFESRPQQIAMLHAVAKAISEGRHLLVEAGTGTGKSMAYLVPAALWAIQNDSRVVISTNTINLQDQLINKDIPDLCAALSLELYATVLKGRNNYLCPRRLESFRRRGPQTPDEMRVLGKILVWLLETSTGDRGEINLNGPVENEIWRRLSAEDEGCTTENCLKRTGGICPFYRSRQAAQAAHLIVVNHALLLADVATGSRVLPEYDTLIADEAHHLEEATTKALSYRVTQWDVERLLREVGGTKTGALGWLLEATHDSVTPSDYASLYHLAEQATDLAFRLENLVRDFYQAIEQFLFEQREGRPMGTYAQQERILPATRTQPAWYQVETAWDQAEHVLQPMIEVLAKLIQGLVENLERLDESDEELFGVFSNLYRRLQELIQQINHLVFNPQSEQIYWVELHPNGGRSALNAAPLHIGSLMQRHIWHEKTAVILTSATLTAAGEFDYLRGRLNAEDAYELALGSPFDYETSTLLYIANDIPEPGDRYGHQRAIEQSLVRLCRATGGRTLVLFTSYDQLRRTSRAISPALAKDSILVYEQGEGASSSSLLDSFRTSDRAVLLGTRAFWEGVDIPGEALSILVIAKLPFDVPSDPVIAARSESFEDPFQQYSLPEAILRFRQGFGRLIRSQKDRGVVAILDRRVLSKRYGRLFLDSLPTCTTRAGSLTDLPKAATQWLNI